MSAYCTLHYYETSMIFISASLSGHWHT